MTIASRPVSKTALCVALEISGPTLFRYEHKGLDLDSFKDDEGGFDVDGVMAAIRDLGFQRKGELSDQDLQRRLQELNLEKLEQDIAHREIEVELKSLKRDIETGRLVPLERMKERDLARVLVVRNGLRALPRRLSQECNGLPAGEMEKIIERHCRALCDQYAEM